MTSMTSSAALTGLAQIISNHQMSPNSHQGTVKVIQKYNIKYIIQVILHQVAIIQNNGLFKLKINNNWPTNL